MTEASQTDKYSFLQLLATFEASRRPGHRLSFVHTPFNGALGQLAPAVTRDKSDLRLGQSPALRRYLSKGVK